MSERRAPDEFNQQILASLGGLQKDIGRVLKGVENLEGWVGNVSNKVDRETGILRESIGGVEKKIDDHLTSESPHGEAIVHRSAGTWIGVVSAVIALGALFVSLKQQEDRPRRDHWRVDADQR